MLQSDKELKDGNRYISLDGLLDCDVAQEVLKGYKLRFLPKMKFYRNFHYFRCHGTFEYSIESVVRQAEGR